jgi:hypothetical protein
VLLPGRPAESLRPRLRRDRHDPAGRTSQIHRNPRTTCSSRARVSGRSSLRSGSGACAVFAPQATNDGSSFSHHVVLIWTVGEHTYGVGFHDVTNIRDTLLRDEELARSIKLVAP